MAETWSRTQSITQPAIKASKAAIQAMATVTENEAAARLGSMTRNTRPTLHSPSLKQPTFDWKRDKYRTEEHPDGSK